MSRLLKLFASQKWVRALRLLSAKRRKLKHKIQGEFSSSFNMKLEKRSERDEFTSIRNLLPAAITYSAPTYILKAIIDLNPNVLSIPSSKISSFSKQGNRLLVLPLQYACSIGASSKTIKTLLSIKDRDCTEQSMSSNISSTITKAAIANHALLNDDENRTALHYAIQRLTSSCSKPSSCLVTLETSSTHQSRSRLTFDEKETILTISYLLDAYPEAVLHSDKYNQSPIDMLEEAKYSDQHLSRSKAEQELLCIVCNILRQTAVQVYRRRKDEWERQGCNCSLLHCNSFGAICNSVRSSIASLEEDATQKSIDGENVEEEHNQKKRIYTRIFTPIPCEKKDFIHTILNGYLA
ncbi:predicted protein [Chaetoceros tenuissimus]|uniref:Uncharacterized protein n=1 Tax=Chaetoceros tenuissimus TaxID=426638 RepID=A0AAD3CWW2_9STRA|nr:predicted protein [Chaetoceros tenuissimus]